MSTQATKTTPAPEKGYAETIDEVDLPDRVLKFVEEYEAMGGDRDRFVWKWIYSLFPSFTLSSVPQRHIEEVRTQKTVFTIFITLLDDVAERYGDSWTFDQIYRTVRWPQVETEEREDVDSAVVEFADRLWTDFEDTLTEAPRYEEFRGVFRYDLRQALNAMDYSRLLNERPSIANLNGAKHYDSHNMVMFPYADIDIMYSPTFEQTDLGVLRELIWDLQKMARIGNWLTTWEREIDEGDYTAGIIVYAIQNGLVTRDELESAGPEGRAAVIDRIKTYRIEDLFLAEWKQLHQKVKDRGLKAKSVDLDAFVAGMETVMEHHKASKGHK